MLSHLQMSVKATNFGINLNRFAHRAYLGVRANNENFMIKENKLLFLVFLNSLIAFLIDFYLGYSEFWLLLLLTELPIIGLTYFAMRGQKWAYILTIIYYFIRSFNFYFPDFYLMTKNGLNFELSINSIGVNVVSLIFFLLLFYDLKSKFDNKSTKTIRVIVTVGLIITVVAGLLTPKSSDYDEPKYNNQLTIEQDTTSNFGEHYKIDIPEDWQTATKYKGTSLFAISPVRDSLDAFRENFNIQVFDINFDLYSSEIVANKLYEQGTSEVPYTVELVSEGFSKEMSDFYSIEYKLSDSTTNVQSKMFCKVEKGKAYSIIFSDSQESFKDNLNEVFLPIIKSFENE
jgi:hypothetical protein